MKRAIVLLLLAHSCLAGTTDDGVPDSRYVDYGKQFAAFTKRLVVVEDSGRVTHSTAVVIAPRHALTAAHVVENFDAGAVGGNTAEGVSIHDDYDTDTFGVNDIAVVRCKDDFGLEYYPRLSCGDEREGDTVTVAGYGLSGSLSAGHSIADGRLRAGTNTIDRFERSMIVCTAQRGSSALELCISPGDSGGPLFVGAGPTARLAGINSCVMSDAGRGLKSREGDETGHTRVSKFREWIRSIVECDE